MRNYFRLTILFLILAELFSFCAFLYPAFNKICFLAIIALAVILSLEKLEYGIYLIFAELFIGSFGYLFFYETGGVKLSLRIGLFLAIFSVWSAKIIISKERRRRFLDGLKDNKFIKWYLLLFVFLILGCINGLLRGNNFSDVFFDANSYIYFALIFPLSDVIKNKEQMNNIFSLLLAASAVIAMKSLFLLFIFSHKMHYAMEYLYTWMRDFRLGELTAMEGGFYRIFSQSHIYVLIALFFVALGLVKQEFDCRRDGACSVSTKNGVLYILFLTVIILGMSRSFWVGGLAAFIAFYSWLVCVFYRTGILMSRCRDGAMLRLRDSAVLGISPKEFRRGSPPERVIRAGAPSLQGATPDTVNLAKFTGALILGFITSVVLLFAIVSFPYPKETIYFSTDLFKDRALTVNDAAGSSRWNLLPVLTKEILKSPILGSGFGTVVTYKSGDPRVLSSSPDGEYTTYAFEWGYLDIILKIGLFGMLAYLRIIWSIFQEGWKRLRVAETERCSVSNFRERMINLPRRRGNAPSLQQCYCLSLSQTDNVLGLMLGIIIILATSIFSPYMNHPLGIGYILLATVAIPIL